MRPPPLLKAQSKEAVPVSIRTGIKVCHSLCRIRAALESRVQPDKAHPDYDPACVASDTIVTQKRLEREPNSVWHPANLASMILSWGRVVEQ